MRCTSASHHFSFDLSTFSIASSMQRPVDWELFKKTHDAWAGFPPMALGWCPRYDDLSAIVGHVLAWERQLMTRRMQDRAHPH